MNFGLFNMNSPFFTIIIPTYNSAKLLAECLDSIINQTFADFEILVMDGDSSDDTLLIVDNYIGNHLNIRVISEKDDGIYDAMNKGIKKAKGEWIYFLGSDDQLINNRAISDVYESIERNNFPDLVYGNVLLGDTNYLHNGEYDICKLYDTNICHQSIFYKRTVFNSVGFFDLSYPALADWLFNFKCYTSKTVRVQYINVLIAKYCLTGLSSATYDPLVIDKDRLFVEFAKRSTKVQYFKLRKYMINTQSMKGRLYYIFFEILYSSALQFNKCEVHLKKLNK